MIPWVIVSIIDEIAWVFGRSTYVRATSGNWFGAERIYFQPRVAGEPRPRRLKRYRGAPLQPSTVVGERVAIAAHVGSETMAVLGPSYPSRRRG